MIKSSFYALLLAILVVSLIFPNMASAIDPITGCKMAETINYNGNPYTKGTTVNDSNPDWGAVCTLNMLNVVLNWIFAALMIFVIIMVLLGAFSLMSAAGDPAKVAKGRNQIMYAAIGLIVALLARAFPSLVQVLFG